jgi:hypothetical protein
LAAALALFELGEEYLDRVQVRRVLRQEEELGLSAMKA